MFNIEKVVHIYIYIYIYIYILYIYISGTPRARLNLFIFLTNISKHLVVLQQYKPTQSCVCKAKFKLYMRLTTAHC